MVEQAYTTDSNSVAGRLAGSNPAWSTTLKNGGAVMAKQKNEKGVAIVAISALVITTLWSGFVFMMFVGLIHHELISAVKPIGYWPSVALGFIVSLFIASFSKGVSQ